MLIARLILLSSYIHLILTNRESFEKIYKHEQDVKTKERMLLVLNVVYQGKVPAQVARDLHRNRTWVCVWLKRYDEEGLEGLKNKPRTGRPSELSEEVICSIKTILKESNQQGWTTKQVEELILKKSGIKYHYTHIYHILRKWGFKQKVPRKVHVNTTAPKEEKEEFKKRQNKYLWMLKATTNNNNSHSKKRKTKALP
ncbi:MAG: helix-turn-helix domain-containing protein [Candidatus Nitrosocosmicus sp.]